MSHSLLLINVVHNTTMNKTLLGHGFVYTLRPTCSDTTCVTTQISFGPDWHPEPIRPERTNLCSCTLVCILAYEYHFISCNYVEYMNMETYAINIYQTWPLEALCQNERTSFTFMIPHICLQSL